MTPVMISIAAFVGVSALIGLVAFVLRDNGSEKAQDRLDTLIGKRRRADSSADILRKTAFESDYRIEHKS